jgi:hypothetical protein
MKALASRASILVTLGILILATACAHTIRSTATAPPSAETLAELWELPQNIASRDLFHGPGGVELAPRPDAEYTWVATDTTGYSPGFEVRGPDGREWNVKIGSEAQPEVVASRVLWAMGYHQPNVYYLPAWKLSGGPGGQQPAGRFRIESPDAEVVSDWSWSENPFVGTQPYNGLIVANLVLNSWDWKTSNNKVYRHSDGNHRYVVRDLGASLGKTSFPVLLKWFPLRGLGQGSRNSIDDFEEQGFIRAVDEQNVDFHYRGIYRHIVDQVRPSDVRWASELLAQISDAQWDDAFRAADYTPEHRTRYIKKIKAKIAEGMAVS